MCVQQAAGNQTLLSKGQAGPDLQHTMQEARWLPQNQHFIMVLKVHHSAPCIVYSLVISRMIGDIGLSTGFPTAFGGRLTTSWSVLLLTELNNPHVGVVQLARRACIKMQFNHRRTQTQKVGLKAK